MAETFRQRFKEVAALNRGSFGLVTLVEELKTGKKYAAKRIDVAEDAELEYSAHVQLGDHPNILKVVAYYKEEDCHRLILEYADGGDLHEAISRSDNEGLRRETIRMVLEQLVDALSYCHSRGICHRDIKPENILLAADGTVKVADWGLASFETMSSEFNLGSEQYMAPECFDPKAGEYDAAKADIWAVGIVLLNCLFGRNPFKVANGTDRLFTDFASSREALFDIFPTLSQDVFAVLRHSLTIDPDNRSLEGVRAALANVKTWTADEELDMLSPASYEFAPPSKAVGIRRPFRVPTAVSGQATPCESWHRESKYTPPSHRCLFSNAFPLTQLDEESSEEYNDTEENSPSGTRVEDGVFAMDGLVDSLAALSTSSSTSSSNAFIINDLDEPRSWADDDDYFPVVPKGDKMILRLAQSADTFS